MGYRIHKGFAASYDVLYDCYQWSICFSDRRGNYFCKRGSNGYTAFKPYFLYHYYSGNWNDIDKNYVYERGCDDRNDAINRIDEVLKEKPLPECRKVQEPFNYSITLEEVSYSYDGKKNALDHISLSIGQGQKAALVGPSGGGKTTLANIVTRFFDPQKGRILIGNVDIRDIPKEVLMNKISFVFQNSRLIKDSILENVRMGKPKHRGRKLYRLWMRHSAWILLKNCRME